MGLAEEAGLLIGMASYLKQCGDIEEGWQSSVASGQTIRVFGEPTDFRGTSLEGCFNIDVYGVDPGRTVSNFIVQNHTLDIIKLE